MGIELPRPPDFVSTVATACLGQYHELLEKFLRSIGVTESNVDEYGIVSYYGDMLSADIWHKGVKVGSISSKWETANGYRFVVECNSYCELG
jgi:hypothetical protein